MTYHFYNVTKCYEILKRELENIDKIAIITEHENYDFEFHINDLLQKFTDK